MPRRLLLAASVAVAVVLLGLLLESSPFPPGADPGHMLALSYSLENDGLTGAVRYAPVLPALMWVSRHIASGDTMSLFWLIKALGVLCLLAEAWGLSTLAGALAGSSAARWGFVLALWNPNSWNQLLWGGYAQMMGVGLGGLALAFMVRHRYIASGILLGGVALTHTYSAFFFGVAALALLFKQRSGSSARVALPALLVALPAVPVYAQLIGVLGFTRTAEAYAVGLSESLQNWLFHAPVSVLMGALFACAVAARRPALASLWPVLLACGMLAFVTPPLLAARAGLFAWHAIVLFMAISFARATPSRTVLLLLCLTPIVTFADLRTLLADYAPLEAEHAEAMQKLAAIADGRALIVSPNPNLDGWWYEGLTDKPALIGDDLRWALLREQQEASIAAQTIAHATRARIHGHERVLTLELPGEETVTSIWAQDIEFFPMVEVRRPSESVAVLTPAPGSRCQTARVLGDSISLRCEYRYAPYRWKGFTRSVVLDVASRTPWSVVESAEKVRIEGEDVTITFRGSEPRERLDDDELLEIWNVSHVWVRASSEAPDTARRFDRDPRFERLWSQAGLVVFRVTR